MPKILLTGATGFLGSHLLKNFIAQGHDLVILKRSTSDVWRIKSYLNQIVSFNVDRTDLKVVFEQNAIDIIVHTACNYGRNNDSISTIIDTNLNLGIRLLEYAIPNGVKTFINTDTLLPKNLNPYSLSKVQFTDWLKKYCQDINIINLRIEHMYGPKDDRKKFIFWLIEEMLSNNNKINLTSGKQKRNFVYIDDVVDAYNLVVEESTNFRNWNQFDVGTNENIEIKQFVLAIAEEIEKNYDKEIITRLNFGAIPYRSGDIMEPILDNSSLFDLGWSPKVNINQGIKKILKEI